MGFWWSVGARVIAGVVFLLVVHWASSSCAVGGRAPSPSPGVATATPAVSEMAPARPLADGNGEDGGWWRKAGAALTASVGNASSLSPASTVTQSALTAVPSATAYVVIDAVPATPVTTARPVETLAPKSDIWSLIAASPWPQSLWGTVACLVERESKGNPVAVGSAGERGLLQAHPITWPYLAQYGITPDALFDPATNLRAGYLLFIEAGGLRPWGGECNA